MTTITSQWIPPLIRINPYLRVITVMVVSTSF